MYQLTLTKHHDPDGTLVVTGDSITKLLEAMNEAADRHGYYTTWIEPRSHGNIFRLDDDTEPVGAWEVSKL
ncbi:hypothetical protein PBI_AN9_90 [Mycobacterium phage AN9]|nr:hypothetical protein PBI_VC3_89 [Mycobacterium phage VC3]QJD52552.1 hypothetical protein PBI_ANI8_90 [Mycobacterium phage ANI8]QJD52644.1 hypothetical protein PBI_AN9_90 [Mycobacterium phage AN9]BBC43644.1 hypothetical protein [Mycobacterium phage C3]